MWSRLFSVNNALPTPLHTQNVRRKNVRERLLDDDEDDAHPPPLKKRAHYSMHPIFDKYKYQSYGNGPPVERQQCRQHVPETLSPAAESPLIKELKRNYAALRVTLHSNGIKDIEKIEEALSKEAVEKINTNISKLYEIATKARQLTASSLDCEVDTQITDKDGRQKTHIVKVGRSLSDYQDLETERSRKLTQLWSSWEKTQSDIDELSRKLHELFGCEPFQGTSGISSNCDLDPREDFDIDRRSKLVVEEMTTCEDGNMLIDDKEFQEKLKDEEANLFEAMLGFSLDDD